MKKRLKNGNSKGTFSVHYAWMVCIGCALLNFCSSGLAINDFTVYQPYILSLNNLTNSQSSLIIMFRSFSTLGALLIVRRYYRVFSLRAGSAIAGGILALGFALFAASKSLPMYCLSAAVTGIGFGFGYTVPVAIMLEHWFKEKRNTALGICSASTGLATLGIPSVISRVIERFGLSRAFLLEAVVIAVLVFISFLLVRDNPEDIGLTALGISAESGKRSGEQTVGLKRGGWFILVPALLMIGGVMNTAYSHLTVHINSKGYAPSTAALEISVVGITLTLGKIIYGRLCDKLGVLKCNYCFIPTLIAGLGLCCFIGSGNFVMYTGMVLLGLGLSYISVGLSSWVPELVRSEDYDRSIQLFQILYALGSLIFSPLPGIIADADNGSYTKAYVLFLALAVFVVSSSQLCISRVGKKRRAAAEGENIQ